MTFLFRNINDVLHSQMKTATQQASSGGHGSADTILDDLVGVLQMLMSDDGAESGSLVSQLESWLYSIHRDLANASKKYRDSANADGNYHELVDVTEKQINLERKWLLARISRSTTAEEAILAINSWATYSKEVYRAQGMDWPAAPLRVSLLRREDYRELMREDLELVRGELNERRRALQAALEFPGAVSCLPDRDEGQTEALRAFDSLVAFDVANVDLSRLMNLITGLQRVLRTRVSLGTWVGYPNEGFDTEIFRESGVGYFLSVRQAVVEDQVEGSRQQLTPAPDAEACRFNRGNYTFEIRDDGAFLRVEFPDGKTGTFGRALLGAKATPSRNPMNRSSTTL